MSPTSCSPRSRSAGCATRSRPPSARGRGGLGMWRTAGTMMDGMYIITTRARTAQHLLVFLAAAPAYRLAIALGWPAALGAGARVAVINTLLALGVVYLAPVATALA